MGDVLCVPADRNRLRALTPGKARSGRSGPPRRLGLAFTGLLAVRTAALALDSSRLSAFSIVAQIPLAPIQAVAPAGFLLLFLQLLVQLVEAVRSRP